MKLLFIILIIVVFLLLFIKNNEHLSLFEKIKEQQYDNKLLFLVKIQNNYYNLYNFNKKQYGNYKNYQDFIKDLTSIFNTENIQDNNQLSKFIKNLYFYTDNILDETLIKINNKSNECEKNYKYSYQILNINGYYYLDGFNQFLKEVFNIYKKYGTNKLLSKNYFILFKNIILTKNICNINLKTGIPNKNIKKNRETTNEITTETTNEITTETTDKINLPEKLEIVLNRRLIYNTSYPELDKKPTKILRKFDKSYFNLYFDLDKHNIDNIDNINSTYNIISNDNINNILVYVNNESNKILNINTFTIDKLLELLFIKYNTNINNKKLDSNFIYSCDGKIYNYTDDDYKKNNLKYLSKYDFFCKYIYEKMNKSNKKKIFNYYGLFLKKAQMNFNMERNKHYYQLICNNDEYINFFSEGCGNIPSNYITELNNCNKKNMQDCETNNDCIYLDNNFFKCIPGTPKKFKEINVSIPDLENPDKRKLTTNLEQQISINPTNMPYYIWFNDKIFNNELNIKNPNNK